jgi:hypothetical protein
MCWKYSVHRLGVEALTVWKQEAVVILLLSLCNISFRLGCTAQTLFSYHCLLAVALTCVVVAGVGVKLPPHLSVCEQYAYDTYYISYDSRRPLKVVVIFQKLAVCVPNNRHSIT